MKTIHDMYEHLNWANQRVLKALQSEEEENHEVCRLFSHILFSEQVWITRLQGLNSSGLTIWGEADTKACAKLVEENKKSFTALLHNLAPEDMDQLISYTNSKGTHFKNSIREILIHVALHGQYHRGQINLRLRATGMEPVNMDFITFKR